MFKLPKDFVLKWLEALRSGKFIQGKNQLYSTHHNEEYCCLGVACIVGGADKEELLMKGVHEDEEVGLEYISTPNLKEKVPLELQDETLLTLILSIMNDGTTLDRDHFDTYPQLKELGFKRNKYIKPKSFKEIADWIEKNIETYE